MNNTDWKILIYLREERSINKVAKRLFMTQPSLTYRLDQMEKEIGVPLFIRTNKGVHFTDAGDRLFSYAEKELQRYQDMKNFVTHEPNTISGVLRIGATRSFTQSHMPTLLKGFVDKYNDIDLSLTTSSSDQLIKLIKKEDIQLAIVRGNPEWPELDVPLANPLLYLISAGKISPETLPCQPTIRYRSDPALDELRSRWWRQNIGDPPHFLLAVDDCLTCIEIVNSGLGHSIIPADLLPKCDPSVYREVLRDKDGRPIYRPIHLICKNAMTVSTPVRLFIEYVKQYFQEHPRLNPQTLSSNTDAQEKQ